MMNLQATIELYCGGPGSGRHPEFGRFRHISTVSMGKVAKHLFRSPGGSEISYEQRLSPSMGKVYESNEGKWTTNEEQPIHDGDVDSAEKFMGEKYGIKN